MSDAERREYHASPSQSITSLHGHWQVLKHIDDNDKQAPGYEVQEECRDLRIDIRLKHEACHVCEWHNCGWIKQKEEPDALVVLVEDEGEHDDQADRNVGHDDIKDDVGGPVSGERHA